MIDAFEAGLAGLKEGLAAVAHEGMRIDLAHVEPAKEGHRHTRSTEEPMKARDIRGR